MVLRLLRPVSVLVLVALAVSTVSGPARAADGLKPAGVFTAKDCVEVAAIVSLAPERSRSALPAGYEPGSFYTKALTALLPLPVVGPIVSTLTPEASLLMGVETCQSGTIGRTRITEPFAFGERVLEVQPRDASPGFHFYAVEQVTDSKQLFTLLKAVGMPVRLVKGIAGHKTPLGGVSQGDNVTITDTAPVPFPSPLDQVNIWRKSTKAGTAVLRLGVTGATATAGIGQVSIEPGGPVARLVGSTSAVGLGAVNSFDFTGRLFVAR